jgi:RNA polymerase sigma-70 factor, ECF subfamily
MDDVNAITRFRAGDKEAFRHLVERYQSQAVGQAVSILGNRENALDAVQEAFIDAFKALGRFDLTRRFYPWFYVMLRNRCFKHAAMAKRIDAASIDEMHILAPQSGLAYDESLSLEAALRALSPEDRELITLKHLDGLSYDELAERLGIPKGTVMSRLYYARKQLRRKLSGRFYQD